MRDHFSSWPPRRRLSWVLVTAMLLAGCEQETAEVRRTVVLSHPLSEATITQAIAAVPGTRLVESSNDGPPTTREDASGRTYVYDDDTQLVNGLLMVQRAGHGEYLLTLSKTWAASPPPAGAMQKTRLLMDRVYLALRQVDPTLPPASEIKEKSFGPEPPS